MKKLRRENEAVYAARHAIARQKMLDILCLLEGRLAFLIGNKARTAADAKALAEAIENGAAALSLLVPPDPPKGRRRPAR
jgi:hypothetical protein